MTVEEALVAALRDSDALVALPIRPDTARQGDVPPYIVYTQFAGDRVQSLSGDSGLANPRFQLDVYGADKTTVTRLKGQVFSAVMADDTLGAVLDDEQSGYEPETKVYRHRLDFSLWFYD